jgi:outer membrane receptor for ferrienterochelin and colicins
VRLFVCLLLPLLIVPIHLHAEDLLPLTGQVQDESDRPLAGVVVRVSGSVTGQIVTDSAGKFHLSVPEGELDLSLTLDNFFPLESHLSLEGPLAVTFTMNSMNASETTIVTASRVNTSILDSPSSSSVLTSQKIENSPAQNYADLLRSLPGVSANQISARVFRITTRQVASAGRIPTELVMVDGRSLNIDLNGSVSWDTIPIDTSQIERIEVVNGPDSAIWGPNAQTGVINIIEKTPAEQAGSSLSLTAGTFNREVTGAPSQLNNGNLFGANFVHGQILNDRFAFKVSGGIFDQDPLARPTGIIPIDLEHNTGGAPYPFFENLGTTQPKFDVRLDQQLKSTARLSYSSGIAWTEGTGHSASGPLDIFPGSFLGYAKVAYNKDNLYTRFITNHIHLTNSFDLVQDSSGQLLKNRYDSHDYTLDGGNSILAASRHLLTFGGTIRMANFDLTLAPAQHSRNEVGAFLQDEFSLDRFRFVLGGRIDKYNVTGFIFSPRLAVVFQPSENQSFRASFSRAFRPPTLLEDYQNLSITLSVLDLGQFDPAFTGTKFPIITKFQGNSDLEPEITTGLELGYTGVLWEKTTISGAVYLNQNDNSIRNAALARYSPENLPENWPLSPEIFASLADQGIFFPSLLRFENSGPIRYHGLELSLEHRYSPNLSFFANYSYQSDPVSLNASNPFPKAQLYKPPNHRFNGGADFFFGKYSANANFQYVGAAFWTDVLDSRFWGPTKSFTMMNSSISRKWNDGRIVTSLNVTNLFNSEVQEHVFGDIIKRSTNLQCRFVF